VAREAAYVDLEQGPKLLPSAHNLDRLMTVEIAIPLGVSDDDGATGIENLMNHVMVVALEIEPELHQQVPARQTDVRSADDPPRSRCVGCPDFLAQVQRRKAVLALAGVEQLFECFPLTIEFPLYCGVGR
jgi:hypothetical protein